MKYTEDIVPLSDLKANPARVVARATEGHTPVVLTRRGRSVAVLQSATDFDRSQEERAFMKAVVAGLSDLESGREISLEEARRQLSEF
jgi:prevent-host-death family protein